MDIKLKYLFLTLSIFLVYSIHGQTSDSKSKKSITINTDYIIQLDGFEDFKKFSTYTTLQLLYKKNVIYSDSLNATEYEFGDTIYPLLLRTGNNSCEIFLEVNNRPNKNFLKRLHINSGRLIKIDTLPTFFCKAKNLDNDNLLEFAAIWDYGEMWDDETGQRLTVYNPINYYELTKTGLVLDTTLTIEKNKLIYGKFNGFFYNENTPIKIDDLGDKLSDEIKRILTQK